MAFVLDGISLKHLEGVHPDLIRVVQDCAANGSFPFTFGVSEGLRNIQQQKADVAAGKSLTMSSRHLDGHAVDLVVLTHGKICWAWPPYYVLADQMKAAAARCGVGMLCGIDFAPKADGPHFELDRAKYPSGAHAPGIRVA